MSSSPPKPSPKPPELSDVMDELHAIRVDLKAVDDRSTYAANLANQAYQASQEAKRMVDEHKVTLREASDAMVKHIDTLQAASDAIVKSNQEQNPTIDAILTTVKTLNKNKTGILTAVAFVGLSIGTFVASIVHAYYAAKGH